MTVYQMKNSLTVDEFNQWVIFDRMEPMNGQAIELAQILTMMSAFMGSKNSTFEDFYINKTPTPFVTQVEKQDDKKALNTTLSGLFK